MHWADNCAVQHKVQGVMYDWLKPEKLHSKSMQSVAFIEPYQNTGRRKSSGEEVYHDGAMNVSIYINSLWGAMESWVGHTVLNSNNTDEEGVHSMVSKI